MTDGSQALEVSTGVEPADPVRSTRLGQRRPVLTFLTILAAVASVLGAVWWSGAVNPRLGGEGSVAWGEGQATSFVQLTNDGPLAIEVESVAGPTLGLDRAEVLLGPPGSTLGSWPAPPSPFRDPAAEDATVSSDEDRSWTRVAPFVLEAGESRMVLVQAVLPCGDPADAAGEVGFERLQVDVRTWLGAHQRVQGPRQDLSLVDGDGCG